MQLFDYVEESIHAAAWCEQALPVGEEAGEGLLFDRFDFFAEPGEGFAADDAEDFGVTPLAMEPAGTEAAFDDAVFRGQLVEGLFGLRGVEREATRDFFEGEGAVGAGVAADEFEDGMGYGFEQRCRDAGREGDAEAVPVACGVFDGDDAFFSGDAYFEQAARAN